MSRVPPLPLMNQSSETFDVDMSPSKDGTFLLTAADETPLDQFSDNRHSKPSTDNPTTVIAYSKAQSTGINFNDKNVYTLSR